MDLVLLIVVAALWLRVMVRALWMLRKGLGGELEGRKTIVALAGGTIFTLLAAGGLANTVRQFLTRSR